MRWVARPACVMPLDRLPKRLAQVGLSPPDQIVARAVLVQMHLAWAVSMVELGLGAVDLGQVEIGPVEATDHKVDERPEYDTENQPASQRWSVPVAGLGIEVRSRRCRSRSRWWS